MPSIPTIPSACYRKMLQGVVHRFLTHGTGTEVYRVDLMPPIQTEYSIGCHSWEESSLLMINNSKRVEAEGLSEKQTTELVPSHLSLISVFNQLT